jgi:dGTPase
VAGNRRAFEPHLQGYVGMHAVSTIRERLESREAQLLAAAGTPSRGAQRPAPEPESDLRTAFQRDRDRVLHSKSFRRLMHKTQVFIAPAADHYRTRLTHTLEVTQIARTIGRALLLNEDLIEAIGLGHDLVVDHLERDGRGLNLTFPVRDGILRHSKLRSGITHSAAGEAGTLEGEVIRIADGIAYINHDLDDAVRAGLVATEDVPEDVVEVLGPTHSRRINTLVTDVIAQSDTSAAPGAIGISPQVQQAADSLREFLFRQVYTPLNEDANTQRAQHIVRALYAHFLEDPERLPAEHQSRSDEESPRRVADFVASMTDRYAIELYEAIFVPHHWSV